MKSRNFESIISRMKPLFTVGIFAVLLSSLGCKSRTVYTPSTFPDSLITYGSYGGFTGAKTTYFILPNGQVFISESTAIDTISYGRISASKAKKLDKRMRKANFAGIKMNSPGNMSYFITQTSAETEHKVVWGANGPTPPKELTEIHDLITTLITNSNETSE